MNNRIEEIVWNHLEGNASDDELKIITNWLDQEKKNLNLFASMKAIHIEIEAQANAGKIQTEKALERFLSSVEKLDYKNKIEANQKGIYIRKAIYRYVSAAVLAAAIGTGVYFIARQLDREGNDKLCTIEVPYGGKSSLSMPDGTKIWLNAGSKLSYKQDFGISSRDVFIEGEGYFEVEKSDHPFIVHTSHFDIHVMGTVFNVKSYPEEENIETTLVEGNIRIERIESQKPLYLKPKQKLTYHKPSKTIEQNNIAVDKEIEDERAAELRKPDISQSSVKRIRIEANIDTEETTSWKDGKLLINNEPLMELVKLLERKYDIEFRFEDISLKKYTYSGTLLDLPLEQVLKALELTSPVNYTIDEKIVYLAKDNARPKIK